MARRNCTVFFSHLRRHSNAAIRHHADAPSVRHRAIRVWLVFGTILAEKNPCAAIALGEQFMSCYSINMIQRLQSGLQLGIIRSPFPEKV